MRPHCEMTTAAVEEYKVMLSEDMTFLDYRKIKKKREEYGPRGKGGND